ncbi:hypothetical protein [Acidaminococcus massiliensis]|mgnify:CR=1 FL=1|jgi:hypothetical protein|uniref:hypothetical protein n=1 Tax=Acidaminococcus massiliensis TaxID=1852375 RepID=UPI00204C4B42|nr:hypothetical protein [Acidaminococcus massiliensis]DAR24924.1 MAG TPA: hypothetical protein [Caudoviricetes sp.]
MKIADDLYLETRIYSENLREAWIVNEKTEKKLCIALLSRNKGTWFLRSIFETHNQPNREEALKKFNKIVSVFSDDFRFLLNK